MAKVTINKQQLAASLLADRGIRREVRRVADRKIAAQMLKVSRKHYRNAVKQVQNSIDGGAGSSGFSSIESSGAKRISFQDVTGATRSIVTNTWKALTNRYRKRKPASKRFWSKTGRLSAAVGRVASSGSAKATISKPTVVRSHHRGKETVKFNIRLSKLRYPFDDLIRGSFLSAQETNISGVQSRGRRGLSRAYWAERFRPFVSRMSGSLGRRYHTALRKIKFSS